MITTGFLARSGLVLLTAMVLQVGVFDQHPVADVPVSVFPALAVGGGLAGGPQRGAVLGFVTGCLADLLLHSPFGLSALSLALVGYAVGSANSMRLRQSRVFPLVAGALGGAGSVVLFATLGELVGQPFLSDPDLLRIVAVRTAGSAVLVLVAEAVLRWAWRSRAERGMVLV